MIPGQDGQSIYSVPEDAQTYYAFVMIPLVNALLCAIIAGLSMGTASRMDLTAKYGEHGLKSVSQSG
jgi:hypothetical protein